MNIVDLIDVFGDFLEINKIDPSKITDIRCESKSIIVVCELENDIETHEIKVENVSLKNKKEILSL